jgi:hypothetical protein
MLFDRQETDDLIGFRRNRDFHDDISRMMHSRLESSVTAISTSGLVDSQLSSQSQASGIKSHSL